MTKQELEKALIGKTIIGVKVHDPRNSEGLFTCDLVALALRDAKGHTSSFIIESLTEDSPMVMRRGVTVTMPTGLWPVGKNKSGD